jgi:hypothetical protein
MKYFICILIIVMLILGCTDTTSPDANPMITIEISQNGTIQETFIVTENENGDIYPILYNDQQIGETEVVTFHHFCGVPEEDPEINFKIIARKNSNYTKFEIVDHFDTLRIDYQLDFDAINESLNCGTLYDTFEGISTNARFSVWKDSAFVDSLFTNDLGRFESSIEADNYLIKSIVMEESFETEIQLIDGYSDYFMDYYQLSYKPNIYIYPQTKILLDVNISFPNSGKVVKSIPAFPENWKNLQIKPDGKINNEFDYLFYESIQPNIFQKTKGWIVKKENLQTFFNKNLQQYGFNKNEIHDFIEHWIPILNESRYYAIYPQVKKQLDPLIQLEFSTQPNNILRLTYFVSELNSNELKLTEPEIPVFEREGFVVTEWGVILDESE